MVAWMLWWALPDNYVARSLTQLVLSFDIRLGESGQGRPIIEFFVELCAGLQPIWGMVPPRHTTVKFTVCDNNIQTLYSGAHCTAFN